MISRNYAWVNEEIEHSDSDCARATALAKKWSELMTAEENKHFRRMARFEDGYYDGPEPCEECDACITGDDGRCEQIKYWEQYAREQQAERDLEIELIEDKLDAIGARMMRTYEHWNEDERYIEYMENREY